MADNENEFLQMGIAPELYEALERDFRDVLQSMVGEKTMDRFRAEYEKLHRALKTSYESEKRLVKNVKELNEIIVNNATRVKAAIKLTQEDSSTIGLLKKEVDKAWRLVETAKEKEEKARKIIGELKSEIAQLHKTVEHGTGLHFSQDNTVQQLMEAKDSMKAELRNKEELIITLQEAKQASEDRANRFESDLAKEREELTKIISQFEAKKEEHLREERKTKNFEISDAKQKQMIKEKDALLKLGDDKQREMQEYQLALQQDKQLLEDNKVELSQKNRDLETIRIEAMKQISNLEKDRALLNEKYETLASQLKDQERQINLTQKEDAKIKRLCSELKSENTRLQDAKFLAIEEKTVATNSVSALTREIEWLRKQADDDRHKLEGLESKRDKFKQSLDQIGKKINEMEETSKADKQTISQMKEQAVANKKVQEALSTETQKLEKERDKFSMEAAKANSNLMQMIEEVRLKRNMIAELKKENIDFESKLKTQQNLYEAVRSDRNLQSKNLIEAQDDVAELKRKFKIASHQISQLKDEIESKDTALTSTQHELGMEKKAGDKNKDLMNEEKAKNLRLENDVKKLENEQTKLTYIIKEAYNEHELKKKEIAKVINQRDVLGTQLIRRNDELALLYEKIKILQTTLSKGESQYAQRLLDIRLLHYSIADLKCELRIVSSQASQINDLRNEIINLNKQLLTERLSVKALSEELENPLNYHRWRKLEGTDPDTWEMLQKIQTLQKRLIKKTEEVVEKDVIIQEKEKLYVELKNLLARQPGPEVAEQLSIYQQNLKEKTNQMKAMAAELNMYQAQVNEYKYEIERLTRELQEMKRRYYEQKRREQMQKEAQNKATGQGYTGIQAQTGPQQRFTGGGFNLAI